VVVGRVRLISGAGITESSSRCGDINVSNFLAQAVIDLQTLSTKHSPDWGDAVGKSRSSGLIQETLFDVRYSHLQQIMHIRLFHTKTTIFAPSLPRYNVRNTPGA